MSLFVSLSCFVALALSLPAHFLSSLALSSTYFQEHLCSESKVSQTFGAGYSWFYIFKSLAAALLSTFWQWPEQSALSTVLSLAEGPVEHLFLIPPTCFTWSTDLTLTALCKRRYSADGRPEQLPFVLVWYEHSSPHIKSGGSVELFKRHLKYHFYMLNFLYQGWMSCGIMCTLCACLYVFVITCPVYLLGGRKNYFIFFFIMCYRACLNKQQPELSTIHLPHLFD